MKFTVEREALAAAVTYVAHSLPQRPPAPVFAGILLHAQDDGSLRLSGFDYESSTDTTIDAVDTEPGRALISGRLLSDIVSTARGHHLQADLTGRMVLHAGSARFTLPTLPLEDYPTLPDPGTPSGTLPGATLAEAVAQVACAVSKDQALPTLTGISLRHHQEAGTLTLAATDRYRFAVRTLPWKTCDLSGDRSALAPAKGLLDAAKACADDLVDFTLPGNSSGLFTLRSQQRTSTLRALEGDLPKYKALFPTEFTHTATVEIAPLKEAVQRVALVTTKEAPLRLTFRADTLLLEAGTQDEAQALDNVATTLDGDGEISLAFNPTYLLDGLNALTSPAVEFQIVTNTKPVVLRSPGTDDDSLRYLLMPIRLSS
ncbi:DNA polymerase III subunit beta [Streptomyces sp. NPDC101209]|uniref:DNA polymerase III subunit beta n=1 Tax=Streptomyces sp. NPDC101209 TaxID=3366129 RepID=UPI0037FF4F8B